MPQLNEVTSAAPATIGNVGPGFDVLGLTVSGPTDHVTARRAPHGEVRIVAIDGDGGRLSRAADANTAAIAAVHTRALAGRGDVGVDLFLSKGIPLESGMGSSAASAAAAAHAVNVLLGSPLRKTDLVGPCLEAEAAVSGRHADNAAPALLGGLVLVRPGEDVPKVQRIPVPEGLLVVVVAPAVRLSTRTSRAVLPDAVPLAARTRNAASIALLISACYSGEIGLLAECIEDEVVTPARLALIPGAADALAAARDQGALGASISGGGPALFALSHSEIAAQSILRGMQAAFGAHGVEASGFVSRADCPGVRVDRPRHMTREGA